MSTINDDAMVRIISTLGLDYNPAITATKMFEARIASLNQQLLQMKANALASARDINHAFSSQLGSMKTLYDQYGQPLKTIQNEAAKASSDIASGFVSASQAAEKHAQTVQNVAKKYNILASEWQRRTSWFLTGAAFYGTLRAAQEAVQTISEVEMGVTQIARVMEDSTFVFKDYRDELLKLGVEFGFTFETVQDIALRWAQAGYNARDSLELTRTSLLALNTAELDAKNATESLIGIMAQWGLTAQDLPLVLDKINKTADDFTVTTQDLIDGLLRSSSAAKIMGLSLEETIALLTVMRETSGRTGREVGNALNSILSYIQRPKSIETLENLGIPVFADAARTQFRNVMEIFQDIASKWPTLSAEIQDAFVKAADDAGLYSEELATAIGLQEQWNDLQQRDIAQAAAGVYRRNYFIAMIERLTQAQEVLNNMMDAAGYSMQENERTMDTLAKKYESLKAACEELAVALGDAGLLDILKSLTDTATDVAETFANMDEDTKALVTTVLELLGALGSLKAVMGLFTTKGIFDVASLLPGWGKLIALVGVAIGAISLYTYNVQKANEVSLEDIRAKETEISQANNLINTYERLKAQVGENSDVKSKLLDIQKQLAALYPEYVDYIDEEGNKLVTNVSLLRDMLDLKQQELALKKQELLSEASTELPKLQKQAQDLENKIKENQQKLASGDTKEKRMYGGYAIEIDTTQQIIKDTQNLIKQLANVKTQISAYKEAMKSTQELSAWDEQAIRRSYIAEATKTASSTKTGTTKGTGVGTSTTSTTSGVNEALQNALRVLEHKKRMDEISIQEEIAYLRKVEQLYVRNAEERMDIEERIYNAEKRLKDKRLQDSINWINEQKELGQLTIEEEIAAWERVREKYKDNTEAVKMATINLYKLRKQLADETFSLEERRIEHLARLGILSTQQQIEAYERLYSSRLDSIEEEYRQTEKLFGLYKELLDEQQRAIREAYDERIKQIEEEAERKKKRQEEIIDEIERELELLDRREAKYDYEKRMADLRKQLAYWSVRTSEEARQKVAEINEQIAEEEHDREIELQRQKLEERKRVAQEEIKAIEEALKKERERYEKSYKLIEKAFEEHSINIIATAGTMAQEAYQQWVNNYFTPLKQALESGDIKRFEDTAKKFNESTSKNAQVYRAAESIVNLKYQYEYEGNKSARDVARQYYDLLEKLEPTVADMLNRMNYNQAKEYIKTLPKSHEGSKVLSYGAAYLAPGELIFPPDLSKKLEELISALYVRPLQQTHTSTIDNSKKVQIDTLLNIENNYMEDEIDAQILSRELRRAIISL